MARRMGLTTMSCTLRSVGRWVLRWSRSEADCCWPRSVREGSGKTWLATLGVLVRREVQGLWLGEEGLTVDIVDCLGVTDEDEGGRHGGK
jgi:hypothetical protein